MKSRLILILFVLAFYRGSVVFATDETIKIENYSYKEGLTASGINNVYKDSKGFLWLCSTNGLFRFDGYSFRNINTLIKDNIGRETYCITEDSDNNFFIGTVNGIIYYNTHTERLYPLKLNFNANFKIFQILLIDNRIWAASNVGLLLINSQKKISPDLVFQTQLLLPDSLHRRTPQDNIVNTLYYSPGSPSLWVGTNGALYELNLKSKFFRYVNSFDQNSIRGISKYNQNILVSSWDGGIFLIDPNNHKLRDDPFVKDVNQIIGEKRVMSAFTDSQNRLWVATFGNGLYIFKKNKNGILSYANYRNELVKQENLKSDFITNMYQDNSGVVWLCTNQPALSKVYFRKSNLKYYNLIKQTGEHNPKEILAICQSKDKGKLWVTTNGGGIYLFDTKMNAFSQFTDKSNKGLRLQSNDVVLCYQDRIGNLWIVYRRIGLYAVPALMANKLLEGNLKTAIKPIDVNALLTKDSRLNSYITTFYEDNENRLWIGGWGSLYILELKKKASNNEANGLIAGFKTTSIYTDYRPGEIDYPISPLLSILEIHKNRYLLGTLGAGIIQLEETSKNKFSGKQLAINAKLPSNHIKLIYKDEGKNMWIGTNAGLCFWNLKTDSFKIITAKEGLSSDNINNIVEDANSNIWVSTSYGISEIKSKDFSIRNYFYSDNDKYNQYISNAAALSSDGMVCFSTNEALVLINPDSADVSKNNAPLYFTDIRIDNNTVVPMEKYNQTCVIEANINESEIINVPYNHTLSIGFAALDYINPAQISYKYKIGNNNEWILMNPGQRNLTLPNMSPGEYTLSIMVASSSGENNTRSIRINYLPPFWRTKTAYIIYFIFILILLFTYRRLLIQEIFQKSIIEKERFERKKLEELDKMKSEFFSNISHEFRTPLSLIINPLEKLIKEDDISNRNKEKIKLILKSSNRLLKLTNELMDFSKIEKKLITPDFQFYEIATFINETCQLFSNLAETMSFDFKINCSFERMEIPIDKGMIEKVMFNLLSNAFKYTPANGMIMVNLGKYHEREKEYVKISVINTGEGIDKENLSKIFDRYYQVNNVQNRNVEGTGIGLALVKSFVELHHGKIDVKSEPNLETCFDVFLPVVQDNLDVTNKSNNPSTDKKHKNIVLNKESKSQITGQSAHYRLLIIEDDEDIRNYIIDELSSEFKILIAKNGEEGLSIANDIIPDLVITDVMMPGLSGFELCRKLKNQVITSHIPILILSAKTNIEHQIEGLTVGADVYMVKPFNMDYLKAQILRLINLKQTIYSRYINDTALIPQGALPTKLDDEFMQKITAFIENNLTNSDLSVDQLANCVSLSKVQTYRKVKAISGLSIVEFIRTIRLKKASIMILEGRLNFSEIAFETGFSTPSYFSKCFHDHFGKTPSEYAFEYNKLIKQTR
jgi:signal transduction histidine kinase/ligand-binding sensor domain-containing protein/DNA-binding response OmpR family regulator